MLPSPFRLCECLDQFSGRATFRSSRGELTWAGPLGWVVRGFLVAVAAGEP